MSKKLIFVLIIFLAAISSLMYVKFFYVTEKKLVQKPNIQKVISNILPRASLYILPNSLVATSSAITTVDVALDTKNTPTSVQLEIAFDPGLIYNLSILPGDYFISPEISLEKIDLENGRISYALNGESTNPISKTLAKIIFTPINYGSQKTTQFKFLPKTSIKQDSKLVKLLKTEGTIITIKPSLFIPSATPSATISQ